MTPLTQAVLVAAQNQAAFQAANPPVIYHPQQGVIAAGYAGQQVAQNGNAAAQGVVGNGNAMANGLVPWGVHQIDPSRMFTKIEAKKFADPRVQIAYDSLSGIWGELREMTAREIVAKLDAFMVRECFELPGEVVV